MPRLLSPDLQVQSVLELNPHRLHELGIDGLLLDVDCTLKSYRAEEVTEEVAAWLEQLRQAGIEMCLLSNGRDGRVRRLAEKLDLPFVAKACKPLPFACRSAARKLGFAPEKIAMVGDQLLADVVAGRLAGLFCILVEPIRPEEEPWFTRLKRPFERYLVRRLGRSGCA